MKKIIVGAVIALVLFIVILVALAPAKVAVPWISDAVPNVNLVNVQGTIWSTKADVVQFKALKLHNVTLSTNPLALLFGSLSSDLSINDQNIKIDSELSISQNDYHLTETSFDVDTSYIATLVRMPIKGLVGRVGGDIEQLHITNQKILALQGKGEWKNAVIKYPNNDLALGNISFILEKVDGSDNMARVKIIDNPGVLDLKGTIEVSLDKRFDMKLHTTTALPENIKNWLTRWGRQQDNRIYLEWQGQLP